MTHGCASVINSAQGLSQFILNENNRLILTCLKVFIQLLYNQQVGTKACLQKRLYNVKYISVTVTEKILEHVGYQIKMNTGIKFPNTSKNLGFTPFFIFNPLKILG